jgi:hypothetical protein
MWRMINVEEDEDSCSVTFFALACDLFYSAANERQQQENRKQRRSPLALAKMCVCVCACVYVFFPLFFFEEAVAD